MRVFIIHDDEGNVVSVGQFEELQAEVAQPFHVSDPKHSVIELDRDDENFKALAADKSPGRKEKLLKLHSESMVDKKSKKLLKKTGRPTPKPDPPPIIKAPPNAPTEPNKPPPDPKRPPVENKTEPGETPPTQVPSEPTEM
ncbi:MAG TPA: hypothetical protein VF611_20835 [Pyrinomonadaceae bacterium]|jgi:hypothetical protein